MGGSKFTMMDACQPSRRSLLQPLLSAQGPLLLFPPSVSSFQPQHQRPRKENKNQYPTMFQNYRFKGIRFRLVDEQHTTDCRTDRDDSVSTLALSHTNPTTIAILDKFFDSSSGIVETTHVCRLRFQISGHYVTLLSGRLSHQVVGQLHPYTSLPLASASTEGTSHSTACNIVIQRVQDAGRLVQADDLGCFFFPSSPGMHPFSHSFHVVQERKKG